MEKEECRRVVFSSLFQGNIASRLSQVKNKQTKKPQNYWKGERVPIDDIRLLYNHLSFRLAFFEIKYQFYKRDQLMKRAVRHYSEEVNFSQVFV